MRSRTLFCMLLSVCLLMLAVPAFAQSSTTGDVIGTVTDPNSAVLTKAAVQARNDSTGENHTTTTNSEGVYRFSLLRPGSYTITANASGFKQATRKVQVGVGQAATVDIQLALTEVTTVVEVTTAPLQVENADMSTHFGSEQVALVPNPGNDLSAIAQTSPGVTMNTQSGFGNFSSFGLPGTSNLFTIDGQNDNDPFLNLNNSGATNLLLGANEVQEATVTNNGYSGQYGQLAGAQVNYVTKSGANQFHGNAIYQWNGRAMNANDFVNNLQIGTNPSTPRPFDNVNQWAVSFGGPIQKGKTFFFWDYEGLRVVLPTSAAAFVPDPNFVAATKANVAGTPSAAFYNQIFNLYGSAKGAATAAPFATCASLANPVPLAGNCVDTFRSTAGNFTQEYLMALRIDHKFSENDSIFGRVQTDRGVQATFTDSINPLFNVQSTQPEYQGQLGWTHVVSTNAVNEFKLSGQWYSAVFAPANLAASLAAFPTTLTFGDSSLSNLGGIDNAFPQGRNVTQYQFVDDYSWSRGKHTFKFGVNYHRNDVTDFDPQINTSGSLTANSLLDFFNGGTTGDTYSQNFPGRKTQPIAVYGVGFYGQDEWRVNKKLKLTLALRLDHNSNPVCQTNCFARLVSPFTSLDHTNSAITPYNQTIKTGFSQAYPGTDFVVWQPRLGFTFSPFADNKTVIRGGIGIFSDSFPATVADTLLGNPPTQATFNIANAPISALGTGGIFDQAVQASSNFQKGFASGGTATSLGLLGAQPGFTSTDPRIRQPRYQEWNLEIQHELGWNTVISANYVGNHGIFEPVANTGLNGFGLAGLPAVAPDQRFSVVTQVQSIAVSNYNGLVLNLRHNASRGLTFQVNYTWSHALDEVSNGGLLPFNNTTNVSPLNPFNPFNLRQNYGNADYDVRHYFSTNYVWENSLRHLFHWGPNAVFGGWTLSGTLFTRSGFPFTVIDGATTALLQGKNFGPNYALPATVNSFPFEPGVSCSSGRATLSPCLNSASFVSAGSLSVNQGRNSFAGPGFFDTDLSVMKYTSLLKEKAQLGIGFQFFNILNHPNFDQPKNNLASASFGEILRSVNTPTSILGSFLGGDASPRLIQFKAEIKF